MTKTKWWNAIYSIRYWQGLGEEPARNSGQLKAGWRRVGVTYSIYVLTGALLAVLAPADVLQQTPTLHSFCNWVASYVAPGISKYEKVSTFPQVTALYFSSMVAGVPI